MTKIPKLNIPKSINKNEFKILSNNFINFINDFFNKIKEDINIEKKISLENNNYNKDFFEGQYNLFQLMQNTLYEKMNNINFWYSILCNKSCGYIYKNENNYEVICGKRIDIKCEQNNYLCATHISLKDHTPKKRNIEEYNKCIELNKYGSRCGNPKKYGEICKKHYEKVYKINIHEIDKHYLYTEEIKKLNNIEIVNTNNSINKNIINFKEKIKNDVKEIVNKSINVKSLYDIIEDIKINIKNTTLIEKLKKEEIYNGGMVLFKDYKSTAHGVLNYNIQNINKIKDNINNYILNIYDEHILIYIYNFLKHTNKNNSCHKYNKSIF